MSIKLFLFMLCFSIIIPFSIFSGDKQHEIVGCEGLDYIMRMSAEEVGYDCDINSENYLWCEFDKDVYWLKTNLTYNKTEPMRTPKYLLEKGADCESISNAIMCLSKAYDQDCKFYYTVAAKWDEDGQDYYAHLGISCYHEGEWKTLY